MAAFATNFKSRGGARGLSSHSLSLCLVIVLLLGIPSAHSSRFYVSERDLYIILHKSYRVQLIQIGQFNQSLVVTLTPQHDDVVKVDPVTIDIPGTTSPDPTFKTAYGITAHGISPGHSDVIFTASPPGFVNMIKVFLRVTVMLSRVIKAISYAMGWMYFVAWSISFYPQIYINWRRKSVVGLNFDFIALNIMGFVMYSFFNCGLYFSPDIQAEYFRRHPRGLNPVLLNDVFFSVHAAFATCITIRQCCKYERAAQRVSTTARCILGVFAAFATISSFFAMAGKLAWLDFLYYCSYIKLAITLMKYMPQAYMNYKRKSTVGWSIGNILLDFTGGNLSILQMVLNAHNYDDWISFFGDATKFGLGLFSICFDIFFILQHYVFYKAARQRDRELTRSRSGLAPGKSTPTSPSTPQPDKSTPTSPSSPQPDKSTPTSPSSPQPDKSTPTSPSSPQPDKSTPTSPPKQLDPISSTPTTPDNSTSTTRPGQPDPNNSAPTTRPP